MQRALYYIILGSIILAFFSNLSGLELRAEEPRRAVVSMEMAESGEWVVPHINGKPYYNKPPVFNWLMASVFKITGSYDEWAVRLPSLLSFLALALLHFFFSKQYIGQRKAALSSLFLITAVDLLFYGSVNSGEIDLFYALVCYGQMIAIFHFFQKRKWLYLFIVSYALLAIGFLTKGMPSLAFQALTLLAYFGVKKEWKRLFSWQHVIGILVLLCLTGGYFYLYDLQADGRSFLIRQFKEAAMRTGAETPILDTVKQFFSFPLRFVVLMLPWGAMIVLLFKRNSWQKIRSNELAFFSFLFILVNIPLYWISGDFKPRYYYMFFPFAMSLFALVAVGEEEGTGKSSLLVKWFFHIAMVLLAIICLVGVYLCVFESTWLYALVIFCVVLVLALWTRLYFSYSMRWLPLVGVLLLMRIVFNFSYIPRSQEGSEALVYRDQINEVLKISGDQSIHILGEAYVFESDASLGPLTFGKTTLETAPLIAYQIPYYIMRSNKQIVQFVHYDDMKPDQYYLIERTAQLQLGMEALASVKDLWIKKEYVLVRTPSSSIAGTAEIHPRVAN